MDLSIVFLGTAAAVPTARRGLSATLIRRGGERILVDCGEGTQRQLIRSVGLADLDDVLVTHLHADHWLGLPGMVKSFELRDRERPLDVFGPPGLRRALGLLDPVLGRPRFGLRVHELEPWDELERDGYRIVAVPARHRATAYGYALVEDDRPGRFDADLARERGVTPGPDFGRLQRGEAVDGVAPEDVVGPPRAGRRIVLSGDTAPSQTLLAAAHGADVLVHEATFTDEDLGRARDTLHSTARQAAELARDAEVRMLCLTHLSARTTAGAIRDEARATFANALVPRDFDVVEVPLPEKGEPVLVREGDAAGTGGTVSAP